MTISTATQNPDYIQLIKKPDLTYADKIVLLYLLHPDYRDMSWRDHCSQLMMSVKTFSLSVERLSEKGYVEVTTRAATNRLRNFNCHRVTSKAKRLYGAAI